MQELPPLTDVRLVNFSEHFDFRSKTIVEPGCYLGEVTLQLLTMGIAKVSPTDGRMENVEATRLACDGRSDQVWSPWFQRCESHADVHVQAKKDFGASDFDACLHMGLLYHTDEPVEQLIQCSLMSDTLLLDTHVAINGSQFAQERMDYLEPHVELIGGLAYEVKTFYELQGDRSCGLGARSFWLTEDSLYNALHYAGFRRIKLVSRDEVKSRLCLIAMKG